MYIAIAAIVAGHVIAVWLAHRLALREFGTRREAALATVPLTLLMVAYTVISLSVIAEPMVIFNAPDAAISRRIRLKPSQQRHQRETQCERKRRDPQQRPQLTLKDALV